MIPNIEKIESQKDASFYVGFYSSKYFERSWHYHKEYELLLITSGYGTRVVGDNTSRFGVGDLVLIGGNLPHAWFSDPLFFKPEHDGICESIYIQFDRSIFGTQFAGLPEMKHIQTLLDEAKYGLVYAPGTDCVKLMNYMSDFPSYQGLERLLKLIEVLSLFKSGCYHPLVSKKYFEDLFFMKSDRITKVHQYVMNNYQHDLSVHQAAALVEMNVSSFCRYFKKNTNKTFSQFVQETRIDYAQQLLINTDLTSNQICFECGFSSVAYFNQCFKAICQVAPLEYRARYKVV